MSYTSFYMKYSRLKWVKYEVSAFTAQLHTNLVINPVSANPTKWSNTPNSLANCRRIV